MRRILTAGGLWALDRFALVLSAAIVQVVIARELGPEKFGTLSYLLALITLLLPFSRTGLTGLLVKNLLEQPKAESSILGVALTWRLLGAITAAGIATTWLPLGVSGLMALALVGTALQLAEHSAQARSEPIEIVPLRLTVTAVGATLKITVAFATHDPTAIAWVFAGEYAAQGAAQWGIIRRYRRYALRPRWQTDWHDEFRSRAPWLLLSELMAMLYHRIDIVMLERLRGPAEAGIYATAARLSEVWYAVPQLVMVALFPVLWQFRETATRWREGVQATADALFWSAFAVAVVMQFIAEPLVTTLFGAEYQAAGAILALHIWAGVFVFMRALVSRWLIAEDLIRLSLWSHGAGAMTNVLLNLWLIPLYGARGAAWATIVSYAVAGWLAFYLPAGTRGLAKQMASAIMLPINWRRLREYRRRGWWAVLGSNQ